MQNFSKLNPQIKIYVKKLAENLEGMNLEQAIEYLKENKQEMDFHKEMLMNQVNTITNRWRSKNNDPLREEYLQADLKNLFEQYFYTFSLEVYLVFRQACFTLEL